MTSMAEHTIVRTIQALGKDIGPAVGSLYNVNTGEIFIDHVQGMEIVVDESVRNTETIICPASVMYEKFNVTDQDRLDILLSPKCLSGSAEVLLHRDETKEQVLLIHTTIEEQQMVGDASCSEEGGLFTHRIISAQYGKRTVLLFEIAKNKLDETPNLFEIVSKLAKNKPCDSSQHGLDDRERGLCSNVTVTVFEDVPGTQVINTLEEAIEYYHHIEEMTAPGDSIVQSVQVSQLGQIVYQQIPRELSTELNDFLRFMTDSLKTSLILKEKDVMKKLPMIKEKIERFSQEITSFLEDLKFLIRKTVHHVRLNQMEPGKLKAILADVKNSPFRMNGQDGDTMQEWISEQVKLCDILENVNAGRKRNACLLSKEESNETDSEAEKKVVFYLCITTEENDLLRSISEYHGLVRGDCPVDTLHEQSLDRYSGSASSQNEDLGDFLRMAENSQFQFVVSEADGAETESGGRVKVFNKGAVIHEDFMPPKLLPPVIIETYTDKVIVEANDQAASVGNYDVEVENYDGSEKYTQTVIGNASHITVDGLTPWTGYTIRFRLDTVIGPSFSPCVKLVTATMAPPLTPTVLQVSAIGCVVRWKRPQDGEDQGSCTMEWEVEISWNDGSRTETASGDSPKINIRLEPNRQYKFKVRAVYKITDQNITYSSKSEYSKSSDPFELSTEAAIELTKNRALVESEVVAEGNPAVHLLQMKLDYTNDDKRLRRLTFGAANSVKPMKTILVVGATGAGKSTLINAFANFLLGVKFEDDYRFRIIDEDLQANQAKSQTTWVTAYVLYHQATFPEELPYSLTIIDTPGFGDTRGIEADKEITEQLSEFFHAKGHEGIDSLDAVGFVVQASLPRLTPTQKYIFDSILALFGNDVRNNIFILMTFADGQKPPVMAAMDEARIPYTKSFKFNNSALFAERSSESETPQDSDDDEDEGGSFDKMCWKMGVTSCKRTFKQLSKVQPISLTLTNQVLDERQRLELKVMGIQQQIREGLSQQKNLESQLECLEKNKTEIEMNKDFEYKDDVPKFRKISLPVGRYVTNCLHCNRTCHDDCIFANDSDKLNCSAMDGGGQNAKCNVCPGHCHWSQHSNTPHRIEIEIVKVTRTVSEMKKQYEMACGKRLTTEEYIVTLIDEIAAQELYTGSLVDQVRESLKKLSEIALRPDPMTTTEYIDILIQSERQQAEKGWQGRVDQLEAVRVRTVTTIQIAEYQGVPVPWNDLKETIEEHRQKEGFVTRATDVIKKMFPSFLKRK